MKKIPLIPRLFFLAVAVKLMIPLAAVCLGKLGVINFEQGFHIRETFTWDNLSRCYFNSDSGWYRGIALYGYENVPLIECDDWYHPYQNFAFFPLLPFLIRGILFLTGDFTYEGFNTAGFILNLIILYTMVTALVKYLKWRHFDEPSIVRTVSVVLLFPFSMHLYFIYTESLFLTLLVFSFLFAEQKKLWALSLTLFLIVLCRPNGLFYLLPVFLAMFTKNGDEARHFQIKWVLPFLAGVIGFGLWMLYQHKATGSYTAFADAQANWGKKAMFPLQALFSHGFWDIQLLSVYVCILMLIAVIRWKEWDLSWNTLVWIGLMLPMTAGSVISMTRYSTVLFPFFTMKKNGKADGLYPILLILFLIVDVFALKWWFEGKSMMY